MYDQSTRDHILDFSCSSFVLFSFGNRVSLCLPGCPGSLAIDQASLKLRHLPVSASWWLGFKSGTTTTTAWIPCPWKLILLPSSYQFSLSTYLWFYMTWACADLVSAILSTLNLCVQLFFCVWKTWVLCSHSLPAALISFLSLLYNYS